MVILSESEKEQAAGRVLLNIWTIIHAPKNKTTPRTILKAVIEAICQLPKEMLDPMIAEVKQAGNVAKRTDYRADQR